jgi:hypothetical protein
MLQHSLTPPPLEPAIPTLNAFNQSVHREPAYTPAIIAKDIPNPVCFREGFMWWVKKRRSRFPLGEIFGGRLSIHLLCLFEKWGLRRWGEPWFKMPKFPLNGHQIQN